jgi:hypothetical protein
MRRFSLASALAALMVCASASSAGAAETIGRLAPTPSVSCTGTTFDFIEPTVSSGTGYVVPSLPPATALVISSWSHNAAPAAGALTMKVFRKVADPATYQVVGHDGPRELVPGALNTFPANVSAQPGDVIGVNSAIPASTACTFSDPGQTHLARMGNLADGESGAFLPGAGDRSINVSAVVEPDCDKDGLGDETQDTNLSTCAGPAGPAPGGHTCKGKPATIVGTGGKDVRTGSRGRDVIVGLGGNDRLIGLTGNDLICGGAGKDKLKGGPGNDFLSGQKGNDKLVGQKGKDKLSGKKGKDVCVGGAGTDKAKGCENTKSI